jgi:vacuolar-type H+-ATPase subunit I/STV1
MNIETALIPLTKQDKIKDALDFFHTLKDLRINNKSQYDNAVALCKDVKEKIKELEDDRKDLVKPYKDKASAIDKEYKSVRDKLENAEKVIKSGMETFYQEQERKRIEEQRKLEAEAEAKRVAAEKKAEEERLKAEAYRQQGKEAMAAKADARAETAEEKAANTVIPVVENTAKVQGVTMIKKYEVKIVDMATAIQSLAANSALHQFLIIDIAGIQAAVNKAKGFVSLPIGFRITEKFQSSVRA